MFPYFLLLLSLIGVFYLREKLKYHRIKQYAAWPQLKPSLLWGHLKALREFIAQGERRRHIDIVLSEIRTHLGNPAAFILDLRPAQRTLCVICSHEVAEQVSRSSKSFPFSMAKSPTARDLEPLLGFHSIITSEGEEWKALRKRFNPGFAPQHLLTLLPCILEKAQYFLRKLDKYAQSGEEFALEELCIDLTFDIIGAVTMDENLDAQLDNPGELTHLYRQLTASFQVKSSMQWIQIDPRMAFYRRPLARRIDSLLKDHVRRKFAELKSGSTDTKSRSVLALSLQDTDHLDARTLNQTCDQLKSFLFAGHDTTSIVLQWAFYELSRTPRALGAIRRELDDLFGSDASPAAVRDLLLSARGEGLISRMSYVSAVIKETLRLYPPSATARYMPPGSGFYVQIGDGKTLCLDGMIVYNCQTIIQRDEAVYGPTKDEFVPERWLDDLDTSMQTNSDEKRADERGRVPAGAWRPFERGPRNCIGQELANLEARVILACAVRRYDFGKVGLGEVVRDASGEPILSPTGQYKVQSELYSTQQVTAKPVDGMRMQVRLNP
ncbi:cytochrome P450 [Aspergillus coremiiformis]|uniref:Cytochrome P450 n=1 Tax=Aspergillus coremiiformis TaxID=138285 RepID=A0A5N6Z4D3_9EURO|nr:cytochrome P450 [Aspergillus coremiiformis]